MGNHGLPPKNWLNNNWNARFWGEHHLWHAGTNQSNIFLRLDGVSVTEFLAASPTFYWSVEKYDIRSRKNGDSSHSSIRNTPKNWSNLKKKWKKKPLVSWLDGSPLLVGSENTHGFNLKTPMVGSPTRPVQSPQWIGENPAWWRLQVANWNMVIQFVDLGIKHGDFP